MEEFKIDILHKVHPTIRKYIIEIWNNGKVGICAGNIQVTKVFNTYKDDEWNDMKYSNCFSLSIPFAGHFLEWDVLFSNDDLDFAPDFDMGNDEFLGDYDPQIIHQHVPSLVSWNSNSSSALIKLIAELLNLYKKYQIKLLLCDKHSMLHFEYSSLVGEIGMHKDDVEVLVEPSGIVHFLISLDFDFSCLPPYMCDKYTSSGPATSMLMVTFHGTDYSNIQPQLFLSPHVEQALGGVGNKHIPPFPPQGCLMDYVPEVRELLANKVKFIVDNYNLKCKYISQLLTLHAASIVEYDTVTYSKATLLFETKNFYWLLIIQISNTFPKETPKWVLRSLYHMSFGELYIETLNDYPYSPRWCPEEMVKRAFKYTVKHVSIFQNNSMKKNIY